MKNYLKNGHWSKIEKEYNEFKITKQQTKCRRYFNSKSWENDDKYFMIRV